jgi:hypothetical protein
MWPGQVLGRGWKVMWRWNGTGGVDVVVVVVVVVVITEMLLFLGALLSRPMSRVTPSEAVIRWVDGLVCGVFGG